MTKTNEFQNIPKEVADAARDATYVVVGLGVLSVQRAQVQRRELQKRLHEADVEKRVAAVRGEVTRRFEQVEEIVEGAIEQIETTLQPLEEQLPPVARNLVEQAHAQARDARSYVRDLIRAAA